MYQEYSANILLIYTRQILPRENRSSLAAALLFDLRTVPRSNRSRDFEFKSSLQVSRYTSQGALMLTKK